jgi:hypothetical protein
MNFIRTPLGIVVVVVLSFAHGGIVYDFLSEVRSKERSADAQPGEVLPMLAYVP